jgi:zeaxanthin glucosyltransferase
MATLARELVRRGHEATFVHRADVRGLLDCDQVGLLPIGLGTHPPGTLAAETARMARGGGMLGTWALLRGLGRTTDMLCREAPDALRAWGAEAIVCDQLEPAGGLIAAHLGLPLVSVANALMINSEPAVPPPLTGFRYDPSPTGLRRNEGLYWVHDRVMGPINAVIARWAARWSLPMRTMEACLSDRAQIGQEVAGFEFPRTALPDCFTYVGPLREAAHGDWSPPPGPAGAPFVFASLGTLQGHRRGLFGRIASACAALDLGLVIAHGGRLSARDIARLPGRVSAHDFVPQPAVIARAAAVVTHGGLNTVMDSLAAGVPVLAVPVAFEQAAIAARLVRSGAGLTIARWRMTTGGTVSALSRLLADPAFATSAGALRREIAAAGGLARAATIVEQTATDAAPARAA